MKKSYYLFSAAFVAAASVSFPAYAAPTEEVAADEEQADEQSGVQDIVVVARRTEENIQTTPVSVSAISGDSLADQQIVGIQQIQATTPNLTFSSAVAQPGSSTVFIRGQGSSDGLMAIDQAVGVYIDGVYAARSTGGATDLVDVQRVEVLRGPQGTLFGRNTTGGAINIIANKPSDILEGSVRVDYGNYDSFLAQGVLNIPLTEGLAVRGVFQHRERDGYGFNATRNEEVGSLKSDYGRISLGIDPEGGKFSVLLSADYSKLKSGGEIIGLKAYDPSLGQVNPAASASAGARPYLPTELLAAICGTQNLPPLPPANAAALNGLTALCPALPAQPGPVSNYVFGQNGNNDIYRTFGGTAANGESESYGASIAMEYELSDAVLVKSTTAWRGVDLSATTDNDGTPYAFSGGRPPVPANRISQDQFSQEVQLSGDIGPVQYILGGFYFVESGTDRSDSFSLFPLNPALSIVDGTVRNQSLAGFGQVIFTVTEGVRITGGLRYTEDKREMSLRNRNVAPNGVETSALGNLVNDPTDPFRANFEREYNYWSYLVSADWQASDDLFFFVKTSRSQRSGGLNTRAVAGGIPPVGFNPETVTDYEAGAKLDLLDNRVRLNLAVFNSEVENVQRNVIGSVIPTGGTQPLLVSGVENAAEARIRGVEVELTVAPVSGLTFGANMGYTDAKYVNFTNLDGSDWSSAKFPYTPKITVGVFADYSVDLGFGTLKLHADYAWRDEAFSSPIASSALQRAGQTAAYIDALNTTLQNTAMMPSYGVLNGRIALQFDEPNLEVAFFARNITKEEYFTRLLAVQNTALGFTAYSPGDPQTYGVSATFKF